MSGVEAYKKDGSRHQGMAGYCQERDTVQVPLSVITEWSRIECPENCIYIVENPSVYSILVRKWRGQRAVMCMNGQPRLASLMTLELLARSDTIIYYAGDLDPEGIQIAQKLRQYYAGKLNYWRMNAEEYARCRSEEIISERRMKILDKLQRDELTELVEDIKKRRVAGYQENLKW